MLGFADVQFTCTCSIIPAHIDTEVLACHIDSNADLHQLENDTEAVTAGVHRLDQRSCAIVARVRPKLVPQLVICLIDILLNHLGKCIEVDLRVAVRSSANQFGGCSLAVGLWRHMRRMHIESICYDLKWREQ